MEILSEITVASLNASTERDVVFNFPHILFFFIQNRRPQKKKIKTEVSWQSLQFYSFELSQMDLQRLIIIICM